jgi:hypothetical protein
MKRAVWFVIIVGTVCVLILCLTGCAAFWTGFGKGVAGDEAPSSEPEENAGVLVGQGTKAVVEAFPFGKVIAGLVALVAVGLAAKKKKGA